MPRSSHLVTLDVTLGQWPLLMGARIVEGVPFWSIAAVPARHRIGPARATAIPSRLMGLTALRLLDGNSDDNRASARGNRSPHTVVLKILLVPAMSQRRQQVRKEPRRLRRHRIPDPSAIRCPRSSESRDPSARTRELLVALQ
jgi:hypothetical protein